MTILRLMLKSCCRHVSSLQVQQHKLLLPSASAMFGSRQKFASDSAASKYRVNHLTKGMILFSSSGEKLSLEQSKGQIVEAGTAKSLKLVPSETQTSSQPLVVLLPWLMSQPKHVNKYARMYLKLGYDVLTVKITPWQLLWPAKGSQLVASDMLRFLELNTDRRQLLVHGFSVGGYLWGEMLALVEQDRERYTVLLQKIVGLIWDSAADMQDIPMGLPTAVFPKNLILQNALRKYVKYHMRTFYEGATQHYIRSSQMFHSSIVRSPALMMFSKRDPIGNPESNLRVRDNWEALGIKTFVKCWEKSNHVGHYHMYPEEYLAEVATFLATIGMLPVACKMQAKL